jgi:hypothetical protein
MTRETEHLESRLFNQNYSELSEREAELLFEQYKLYVEMMDKVSDRRHNANSFFLSANTALVTALAGFSSLFQKSSSQSSSVGLVVVVAFAGVTFCFTWWRLISSYGQLNTGKFKIIHLLESRLPARLYAAEWVALGQGNGSVYKPFTKVEIYIPIIFAGLYIAIAILTGLRR